ncbi:MAG: hypothetical protein AAF194_00785 [Pseudomonadota bacterium]
MDLTATQIVADDWAVGARLAELGVSREKLLEVVDTAVAAAADATPFHPSNAAGTFAYQYGTFALRNAFVGEDWTTDRTYQLEAIRNDALNVRVTYSNVDVATNHEFGPKPRSRKGAGAERACQGYLLEGLPQYAQVSDDDTATYYLMVDSQGAAELTRPVVKNGTFHAYVERIFLRGPDDDERVSQFEPDTEVDGDFQPTVVRKA